MKTEKFYYSLDFHGVDLAKIAAENTLFSGTFGPEHMATIRAVNPEAKFYWYLLTRLLQPWVEDHWKMFAKKHHLDQELIYVLDNQGRRLLATDASRPWPVVNIGNLDIRWWSYVFAKQYAKHSDGVNVDHPFQWTGEEPYPGYHEDCLEWLWNLSGQIGGKEVIINISDAARYLEGPQAERLKRLRHRVTMWAQGGLGFFENERFILGVDNKNLYTSERP